MWHWMSEAWELLLHAWAAVVLIAFLAAVTLSVVAAAFRYLGDPRYRAVIKDRRGQKRAQFRSRPRLSRILLRFASFWVGLVALVNLAVILEAFLEAGAINGFLKIQDMYSPFTISTYIINAVLLAPAFLLFWCAEKVETKSLNNTSKNA